MINSASASGISYSYSARAIPRRGPLIVITAILSDIRTRTLRLLYEAINPSRMFTAANYGVRPRIVRNQKLSFDLNRCVMKAQLQIRALIRGHTVPYWTFAVVVEVSGSLPLPKFQVHLAHRFFATIPAHLSAPPFDADYR